MYGRTTGGGAAGVGLAATGFAIGVWLAVAVALVVIGALVLRAAMVRPRPDSPK